MDKVDPTTLSIYERLAKYPDSFTDEDLQEIAGWYEDRPKSGVWGQFPAMAFFILEERRKNNYTKEEEWHPSADSEETPVREK